MRFPIYLFLPLIGGVKLFLVPKQLGTRGCFALRACNAYYR